MLLVPISGSSLSRSCVKLWTDQSSYHKLHQERLGSRLASVNNWSRSWFLQYMGLIDQLFNHKATTIGNNTLSPPDEHAEGVTSLPLWTELLYTPWKVCAPYRFRLGSSILKWLLGFQMLTLIWLCFDVEIVWVRKVPPAHKAVVKTHYRSLPRCAVSLVLVFFWPYNIVLRYLYVPRWLTRADGPLAKVGTFSLGGETRKYWGLSLYSVSSPKFGYE